MFRLSMFIAIAFSMTVMCSAVTPASASSSRVFGDRLEQALPRLHPVTYAGQDDVQASEQEEGMNEPERNYGAPIQRSSSITTTQCSPFCWHASRASLRASSSVGAVRYAAFCFPGVRAKAFSPGAVRYAWT